MKKISVLAACILLAGSAVAADPQVKVAVAQADKAVPSKAATKPARPAVVKTSAAVYDYRLERESCCGPQN